jgi:hypothetical protein
MAPPQPPEPRRPGYEEREVYIPGVVLWFLDLFPGLLKPGVIVFALMAFGLSLVGIYVSAFMLQMGALIAVFAIGGGAVMVYWAGWCWMLSGTICSPLEAMVEFGEKHWIALVMLTLVPGSLFLLLMKMAAASQQ